MNKFRNIAFVLAGVLVGPLLALAVQISVPSALHYGDVLVGQSTGNYTPTATSSLGLPTFSSINAAFPFTSRSYGVSTSTTVGFLNGLLTTASSTLNASTTITGQLTLTGATTTASKGIYSPCFSTDGTNCTTSRTLGMSFVVKPGDSIQSALTSAANNGGGTIYVQKGTYTLTTGLLMSSHTHIMCEPGATIAAGWTPPALHGSMTTINQGVLVTNTNFAAQTTTDTDLTVDGCTFSSAGMNAIVFRQASDIIISNNIHTSSGGGFEAMIGDTRYTIENNVSTGPNTCLDNWEAPSHAHIIHNQCTTTNGSQDDAILFTGTDVNFNGTASISGTTLTVTAVSYGSPLLGDIITTGVGVTSNTKITAFVSGTYGGVGVYTVNNSQTVGSEAMSGESAGMGTDAEISGNTILGAPDASGIWLNGLGAPGSGVSNVRVTNNYVDCSLAVVGIKISGAGTDNLIQGNICDGPTTGAAIWEFPDSGGLPSNTIIRDNHVPNANFSISGRGVYVAEGTNTMIKDNYADGTYGYLVDLGTSVNATVMGNVSSTTPTIALYKTSGAVNPTICDFLSLCTLHAITGFFGLGSYLTGFTNGNIPFGSSGLLATSSALTWSNTGSLLTATNASTTAFSIGGPAWDTNVENAVLGTDNNGLVVATTSIGVNYLSGVLPIANGGTNNSSAYTAGSVIYSDGTKLTQDNANFFWDATNHRLGIGTTTPSSPVTIGGCQDASPPTWKGILTIENGCQAQTLNNNGGIEFVGSKTTAGYAWRLGAWDLAGGSDPFVWESRSNSPTWTEYMRLTNTGNLGLGTSSPVWLLNPFSSSAPQLALSAGAGFSQWVFRNAGGLFALATTTVNGTATSSVSALTIDQNGFLTTPAIAAASGNNCVQVDATGKITNTGSACGSGSGTVTSVTGTWPILSTGGNTPVISWGGLATSTNGVLNQLAYWSSASQLGSEATTTAFPNNVAAGFTGATNFGTGSVILGENGAALQGLTAVAAGSYLASNGLTTNPIWTATSTGFPNNVSSGFTGDSSFTAYKVITSGATASSALVASSTIDIGFLSGILPIANGGTGANSIGKLQLLATDLNGNTISTSTPTAAAFNATSTTATSNFASFINTSGTTGGYQINGNTILQASSTLTSLFVGASGNNSYTGTGNLGIGTSVLANDTTGNTNVGIGYQALLNATSSNSNVAIGYQAVLGDATISGKTQNVGIGYQPLLSVTTGLQNVAIGLQAMDKDTTGSFNDAISVGGLFSNTTGAQNNAFGWHALFSGTTASFDTGIGSSALSSNTTGASDVAVGINSLGNNISATTSVAIGSNAGFGNGGQYNNQGGTYIGANSGFDVATSSDYNTFVGFQSGDDVTTGYDNILLGPEVNSGGSHLTTGGNDICIGYNCILPGGTSALNQLNIGNFIFATGMTATSSGTTIPASLTGSVGIGTTSPISRFTVNGPGQFGNDGSSGLRIQNNGTTIELLGINSYNNAYNPIQISTAASPTMYFDTSGHVGIGTTTPQWLLNPFSTSAPQLALSAGAGFSQWVERNVGGQFALATTTVNGTATSTASALALDQNGVLYLYDYATCNGATNALGITAGKVACDSGVSDARLKKDITPLPDGLSVIDALNPVSFFWKDLTNHNTTDPRQQYGFVAQDVAPIIPSAVGTSPDGYYTLDKTAIIPYLVKAVQELQQAKGGSVVVAAKRSAEENWQWIAIGLLVLWNIYLTVRRRR